MDTYTMLMFSGWSFVPNKKGLIPEMRTSLLSDTSCLFAHGSFSEPFFLFLQPCLFPLDLILLKECLWNSRVTSESW